MYEKFDTMLKEVDEEYRTTLIDFAKYKLVMFTMAKIMEMEQVERNKITSYLANDVNWKMYFLTFLCKYVIIINDVTFYNSVASVAINKFYYG